MTDTEKEILFNKFEILKCYKKDEYSAVFLANHIFLDKKVFLKILNTQTIPEPKIVDRFKLEAKILAKLDHPNIIKVFDFGTSKEYFYISFEYFASENLREFFQKSDIKSEQKKEIVIQIIKGLNYVHNNNILHRDIKPENILVNDRNEVKLTDFGLAQLSQENYITQKFSVVGTPAYMSPEQINGQPLTVKSDLFSLGITIFEIYSGKNPFLGNNASETINNIISFDEKRSRLEMEAFPNDISSILKGLLTSLPENRLNSVSDCLDLLGIDYALPARKQNRIPLLRIFLIILVIGSAGLIYIIFIPGSGKVNSEEHSMSGAIRDTMSEQFVINDNIDTEDLVKDDPAESIRNDNAEESIPVAIADKEITSEEKSETPPALKMGSFFIKCYPWAEIFLNDQYVETTPLAKNISAVPGNYLLSLKHPNYPVYSDTIKINSDELYSMEINLDTLFGFLDCHVYPWGEIYINDAFKGVTPLKFPIPLEAGKHNLEIINPQYEKINTYINISRKDTLKVRFNLAQANDK